jgi:hypothetical protein
VPPTMPQQPPAHSSPTAGPNADHFSFPSTPKSGAGKAQAGQMQATPASKSGL